MSNQENTMTGAGSYGSEAELRAAIKAHTSDKPEGKPNFALRRTLLAAGLGVSAAAAFFGVRAVQSAHNQDSLNSELSQPFPDVAAEIRDGKIDPSQVTKFKVGETEYAWTAASDITHESHQGDTPVVSSIIEAQEGNPVQAGSPVILPNSEVDPQR